MYPPNSTGVSAKLKVALPNFRREIEMLLAVGTSGSEGNLVVFHVGLGAVVNSI